MTSSSIHEQTTAPPQEAPLETGIAAETASLIKLAKETASLTRSFFELLILEVRLAVQAVPKIICLGLMALLLMVFAWLSFAATVAWLSAVVFHSTGWGILAFLVLQLVALFTCMFLVRRYSSRLTLPNSRSFLKQLEDTLNATNR
jgi:hypothetical protein